MVLILVFFANRYLIYANLNVLANTAIIKPVMHPSRIDTVKLLSIFLNSVFG